MFQLNKRIQQFYSLLAMIFFFAFLPIAVLAYLIIRLLPRDKQIGAVYFVNRVYVTIWSAFVAIRYKVTNSDIIDNSQNYIVIANHTNVYDMVGINCGLYVAAKPLVKKELFTVPLLGWLFRLSCIAVDRKNKESRKESLRKMENELENGTSLLIFPEGTRNKSQDVLGDFHDGAFQLAKVTKTPILCLVFSNIKHLQKPKTWYFKPGIVQLDYLRIISPSDFASKTVSELKSHCHGLMKERITFNEGGQFSTHYT